MRFIVDNQEVTILNDFMCNVKFPDGSYAPLYKVFPDVQRANFDSGYLVVNGLIKASLGASAVVAENDGMPVAYINQSMQMDK